MSRALLSVVLAASAAALAEDPPLPDPDKPVDYVAWINAQYSKGIEENAAEVYREALDAFVEDKQALELATRWDPPWRDYERRKLGVAEPRPTGVGPLALAGNVGAHVVRLEVFPKAWIDAGSVAQPTG